MDFSDNENEDDEEDDEFESEEEDFSDIEDRENDETSVNRTKSSTRKPEKDKWIPKAVLNEILIILLTYKLYFISV